MQQTKQQFDLTNEEIKQLELYLVSLHSECDFLMQNIEKRHDARVDEEHGLDEVSAVDAGMQAKSREFVESGSKLYDKI